MMDGALLNAWAQGHDVALASLSNVTNDLYGYTKPRRVAPRSQPLDEFPERVINQAGFEDGDGRVDQAWELVLNTAALKFILQTRFSLVTSTYDLATIYTRRHELDTYGRYNCYITKPKPGTTLEYLRRGLFRVVFRFTDLQVL